jgi:hypothetical protein
VAFNTVSQPGAPGPAGDFAWQRQHLVDEIGRRQAGIAAAEADIGRAVVTELRAATRPPWSAEVAGEIERIAAAE